MVVGEEASLRALRIPAMAVACSFLFVAVLAIVTNIVGPYQMDFVSYWAASVLGLGGNPAGAYDFALHRAVEQGAVGLAGGLPFAYPPFFLLLLAPFGLLPYPLAAAGWILATFAFYVAAARRLAPGFPWLALAFPPVLVNAITGQSGFLTAGLLVGGLALLPKRPLAAGLLLGCLVVKPQLGLVLPFVLLAGRQWRAIAGAAASSAGLILAGLIVYGWGAYAAWLGNAQLFASIVADGLAGWHKMASVYASLRLAGLGGEAAWTVHALVAVAAALAACRVWRRDCPWGAKAGALAAATALASPYLYVYDTLILVVPFVWLVSLGRNRVLLVLLWCLPFLSLAQIAGFDASMNLAPLVPAALLVLISLSTGRRGSAGLDEPAPAPVGLRAA